MDCILAYMYECWRADAPVELSNSIQWLSQHHFEHVHQVEVARYGSKVQESYKLGVKKSVAYGVFTGGQ